MKLKNLSFVFIVILSFCIAGCVKEEKQEEQKIKVQKRIGDDGGYEEFKEVNDPIEVGKVENILNDTNWIKAKFEMSRPPDYQFLFQFKNPDIKAKVVLYRVWVSSNKETLEIIRGDDQYAKLTKEQSEILFEIITSD
ncbi:hypothetical protein BAMA_07870 [Bacillus manliponensis]|uniref:YhfM-like domain-containing protein n=1 Tax=Bacillus manliponensis TaxID=574376 RepID=A0A073K6U4_9BACI|nr:hypothetical protein [Bacillus manliponensis]KEK17943.1 hypothetical protein BAMA_07870 [Bacillus manliponensis]